jgi:hypothetical protein
LSAEPDGDKVKEQINLARLLGRREAFSMVAGRCSAADAQILRQVRDEKLYLALAADWEEFCVTYLHMSRATVNRIISWLNEFGIQYFEIAQLTRISPETYRLIAPSIQDGELHTNGEAIALIPENAEKVAAAVAALRTSAAKPEPKPVPISSLREECKALIGRFAAASASGQDRLELSRTLTELMEGLMRFSIGLPVR